jgi:hypothetical protein
MDQERSSFKEGHARLAGSIDPEQNRVSPSSICLAIGYREVRRFRQANETFMEKKNKWHNVSFDSTTYSLCKVMAESKGQSTASYVRELVLYALHDEYVDRLRTIYRKLLKAHAKDALKVS